MCDQQRLRPACAYTQSDQSLCSSLEYSMSVKLLTEHHLDFLSLKGRLHRLVSVYICQNTNLLEITCRVSNNSVLLQSCSAILISQSIKLYSLYSYIKHVKCEALVHTNKHIILVMVALTFTEITFWHSNLTIYSICMDLPTYHEVVPRDFETLIFRISIKLSLINCCLSNTPIWPHSYEIFNAQLN